MSCFSLAGCLRVLYALCTLTCAWQRQNGLLPVAVGLGTFVDFRSERKDSLAGNTPLYYPKIQEAGASRQLHPRSCTYTLRVELVCTIVTHLRV